MRAAIAARNREGVLHELGGEATSSMSAVNSVLAWRVARRRAAALFLGAAAVYLVGGLVLTMTINVPMNEELAGVAVPASVEAARHIWDDYSGRWQTWNIVRTVCSGISLILAAVGLTALVRSRQLLPQ
jgi:uncharacterized membrane protein